MSSPIANSEQECIPEELLGQPVIISPPLAVFESETDVQISSSPKTLASPLPPSQISVQTTPAAASSNVV